MGPRYPTLRRRLNYAAFALCVIAGTLITACTDAAAPDAGTAGRQLLRDGEYSAWEWHPNSGEIVFATPSQFSDSRIEAINVSDGKRRTIAAARPKGARISPFRVQMVGVNVYFLTRPDEEGTSLFRTPLDGSSPAQIVLDSSALSWFVSPDETKVAWISAVSVPPFASVVIADVATGKRSVYSLAYAGDLVAWSPSGKTIVIHPSGVFGEGTPFQVLDVESAIIRPWIGTPVDVTIDMKRDLGWEGENPFLYLTGSNLVVRYSLMFGVRTILATLAAPAQAVGWSKSFSTVTLATNTCLQVSTGPFGGSCILWSSSIDRLDLATGATVNILKSKSQQAIGGRLSPSGASIAYAFGNCATGCADAAGLYVTGSN